MVCCIVSATPDKLALLVGISNYDVLDSETEWTNIHGVNDIDLLSPLLTQQGFNVVVLTDKDATKKNIISELQKIENKAKNGSIIYIHFSTHGQPFQDFDGDEEDGWDESVVPVDAEIKYIKGKYEGQNHITDDELLIHTNKIRQAIGNNGCVYVVMDACHAGRASRGGFGGINTIRGTKRGFSMDNNIYSAIKDTKSLYKIENVPNWAPITFLEACKNTQANSEILREGSYYGPMSYYISILLKETILGTDISWVYTVKNMMKSDISLRRQNMVIETSKQDENGK